MSFKAMRKLKAAVGDTQKEGKLVEGNTQIKKTFGCEVGDNNKKVACINYI